MEKYNNFDSETFPACSTSEMLILAPLKQKVDIKIAWATQRLAVISKKTQKEHLQSYACGFC